MLPARPFSLAALVLFVDVFGSIIRGKPGCWPPLLRLLVARRGSTSGLFLRMGALWGLTTYEPWVTLLVFLFPWHRGVRARAPLVPPLCLAPYARGGVLRLGRWEGVPPFGTVPLFGCTMMGSGAGTRRFRRVRLRFTGPLCPVFGAGFLVGILRSSTGAGGPLGSVRWGGR